MKGGACGVRQQLPVFRDLDKTDPVILFSLVMDWAGVLRKPVIGCTAHLLRIKVAALAVTDGIKLFFVCLLYD